MDNKKLVGALVVGGTIIGAIAAVMVVPEFRRWVHLDPAVSDSREQQHQAPIT